MGQDTRSLFQYLKDTGYNFLIGGFHVKGQVIDVKGISAWGYGGQTVERGDWIDGKPSPNPADQLNAWKKQVVTCEHELPGTAKHDPLAYLQNRTVDWLDHQLAARELLKLDVANTHLVVEHEYPKARIQDKERLKPILRARSRSSAASTKPRPACTRCSTKCWPRRTSPCRASAARRIARSTRSSPSPHCPPPPRRGAFFYFVGPAAPPPSFQVVARTLTRIHIACVPGGNVMANVSGYALALGGAPHSRCEPRGIESLGDSGKCKPLSLGEGQG